MWCDDRVVALVCDDTLFVKITPAGKEMLAGRYKEGAPYPGAKPHMQIPEDMLDDRDFLSELVRITADAPPKPKPKKIKKRGKKH